MLIKKTLIYSSPWPSPIMPGIVKESSFKRLLILVSLLKALTLVLNITIVYKKKPSPFLLLNNLKNVIIIIINKNLIMGLLNYLIIINKALKNK
jgi:hypothetical protein